MNLFYICRFGVCCVFLISETGKSVNENCTYIRNPGFPNGYATTSEVSHTIQKCSPGTYLIMHINSSFVVSNWSNLI